MTYDLTVIFGTEACHAISYATSIGGLQELGHVTTIEFETDAERKAYIRGIEDAEGYLEIMWYRGDERQLKRDLKENEGKDE
jgi:hypothetical protein